MELRVNTDKYTDIAGHFNIPHQTPYKTSRKISKLARILMI